ncbi:hypothetical protein ABW19_dt0208648 [Dactylella cylindrospora]|nr:hypothetical protein ABW19_dt0208648 [Dactylella cylindrospora]
MPENPRSIEERRVIPQDPPDLEQTNEKPAIALSLGPVLSSSSVQRLPLDVQLIIIEQADWKEHARLRMVCRSWKSFLQTSSAVLSNRYRLSGYLKEQQERFDKDELWNKNLPQGHRAMGFFNALYRDKGGGWQPCRFNRDGDLTKEEMLDWFEHEELWSKRQEWTHGPDRISGKIFPDNGMSFFKDDPWAIWGAGEGPRFEIRPGFTQLGNQFYRNSYRTRIPQKISITSDMTVKEFWQEVLNLVNKEAEWIYQSRRKSLDGSKDRYAGACNIIEVYHGLYVPIVNGKPFDMGKVVSDMLLLAIHVDLHD